MRSNFTADWAFGIKGAIENIVRKEFPREIRNWPLLQTFNFEAYSLHNDYMVITLEDKLSGIPAGPGIAKQFPHSDHPAIPPKLSDVAIWQFYLRDKFSLKEEDAVFLIPIRDSGKNSAAEDFKLFSTEEKMFWHYQIQHVVERQVTYLKPETKTQPMAPVHITYNNNISGTNSRVNINSQDSSVNIVNEGNVEIFNQLRETASKIEDQIKRESIISTINELEEANGSEIFSSKYKEFMSVIADHITIFAPLLPTLAMLLT